MPVPVCIYHDTAALAADLARRIHTAALEAIDQRGRFHLALPGGSALQRLAEGFAARPGPDGRAWQIFWSDERAVPRDHADSNHALAQQLLFAHGHLPQAARYPVFDREPRPDPATAAHAYEQLLRQHLPANRPGWPVFDLILLGVGTDGHVASLFPGHPALETTDQAVVALRDAPKPPPQRVTFTLPLLNAARDILIVATGREKAGIVTRLTTASDVERTEPAARIRPSGNGPQWLVDQAAAPPTPEENTE